MRQSIVHVIASLNRGGAELNLLRLVRNSEDNHHTVVNLTRNGSLVEEFRGAGADVIELGIGRTGFLSAISKLRKIIKRKKPQVVQGWMYHSNLIASAAALLCGVRKIAWNLRGIDIPQSPLSVTGAIVWLNAKASYFIPEAIVCCGEEVRNAHIKRGFCQKKLITIANGYEISNEGYARVYETRMKCMARPFVAGLVGRWDKLKGHGLFIESAKYIIAQNKDIKFLLVGRDINSKNDELRALIATAEEMENIELADETTNILEIYEKISVLCLPSKSEGFPNVVAEAMLCGVPCVVFDVGEAKHIVGNAGVVVGRRSPRSMADGILRLYSLEEEDWKHIQQEARKQIVENYNVDKTVEMYRRIYE